jgi:hypothetical protein
VISIRGDYVPPDRTEELVEEAQIEVDYSRDCDPLTGCLGDNYEYGYEDDVEDDDDVEDGDGDEKEEEDEGADSPHDILCRCLITLEAGNPPASSQSLINEAVAHTVATTGTKKLLLEIVSPNQQWDIAHGLAALQKDAGHCGADSAYLIRFLDKSAADPSSSTSTIQSLHTENLQENLTKTSVITVVYDDEAKAFISIY